MRKIESSVENGDPNFGDGQKINRLPREERVQLIETRVRACSDIYARRSNISFTPRKGTMLFWRNVGLDMVPDPRTRHSGERVTAGCATTQRVGATI